MPAVARVFFCAHFQVCWVSRFNLNCRFCKSKVYWFLETERFLPVSIRVSWFLFWFWMGKRCCTFKSMLNIISYCLSNFNWDLLVHNDMWQEKERNPAPRVSFISSFKCLCYVTLYFFLSLLHRQKGGSQRWDSNTIRQPKTMYVRDEALP